MNEVRDFLQQWFLVLGALFIALKEAPRAARVLGAFWGWLKCHLFIPDVYRRLRHLEKKSKELEEEQGEIAT